MEEAAQPTGNTPATSSAVALLVPLRSPKYKRDYGTLPVPTSPYLHEKCDLETAVATTGTAVTSIEGFASNSLATRVKKALLLFALTVLAFSLMRAFVPGTLHPGGSTCHWLAPSPFRPHPPPKKGAKDQEKMDYIKEMMKHAWSGYASYAWGMDELNPLSKTGYNWYAPGTLWQTALDSLDTLYIMGLTEEFNDAKEAVVKYYLEDSEPGVDRFSKLSGKVSLFETNIRILGGLLSAYELDGDDRLLKSAEVVADRLLKSFLWHGDDLLIPLNNVNFTSGEATDYMGGKSAVILAQTGTMVLEFQYLSDVSGNKTYGRIAEVAEHQTYAIQGSHIKGLLPMYFSALEKTFPKAQSFGLGAQSDSHYEYLLKYWVATGNKKFLQYYDQAVNAFVIHLIQETVDGKYVYFDDLHTVDGNKTSQGHRYHHLSCFAAGMLGMGAVKSCPHRPRPRHLHVRPGPLAQKRPSIMSWAAGRHGPRHPPHDCLHRELAIAAGIAEACYAASTAPGALGVGFEEATMVETELAGVWKPILNNPFYILRPETVEGFFYMWRLTHDPKWREKGWEMAQNMNKHCRDDAGFHDIRNVLDGSTVDRMESFFLSETLKYLYLLFADDDTISLDKYVFNTEAHPYSIRGHGKRAHLKWGA
ncbi:glycoside hydrolase [Zopfochytrium polystomum]|nr:glycoside hydrolase [Zopfochytrium polystomum]